MRVDQYLLFLSPYKITDWMKKIQILFILILLCITTGVVYSQNLKENELVVIEGKKFILHQVRTGETVFSISKNFKVESSELTKYNPGISEGLSIGEILKIPFNEDVDLSDLPRYEKGDPTGFIEHTVKNRKETAYALSKMYGITVEEIYAYNPTVRKFKKGMTIKIPQWNYEVEKADEELTKKEDEVEEKIREHLVVSGETLYSISKQYNVPVSEILLLNPEAQNLKAGTKIYIPKAKPESELTKETFAGDDDSGYLIHTVVSGETLYGITKKYNVTEEQLIELNPEIEKSFQSGMHLRIPVNQSGAGETSIWFSGELSGNKTIKPYVVFMNDIPEDCWPGARTGIYDTINVALFLPLFLEANKELNLEFFEEENDTLTPVIEADTIIPEIVQIDTTVIEEELPLLLQKQFYGKSENFLQFYEGVLLAVDSMQKAGMKIKLHVFDTKDNPAQIREVIQTEKFKSTDLIIGPVYENVQTEVARIASANDIPMVSPFTSKSNLIRNYPQFFQINPSRDYIIETTADLVAVNDTNLNYVVLQTSPFGGTSEGHLVDLIRKKIENSESPKKPKFTVYDFRTNRAQGFPELLPKEKQNIVIIPTTDEGELSVAISNLNNMTDTVSITLIGTNNYQQRYPNIELEHFHNLNLKYINPYWVNYSDSMTVSFFQKFISEFGTEPNNYGVQGFDVAYYFLNAIHYFGNDFENCLQYFSVKLLQGKYYFDKVSQWGGYMNKGVSVLGYRKDFEVREEYIIGLPDFPFEVKGEIQNTEPSSRNNEMENGSGNQ